MPGVPQASLTPLRASDRRLRFVRAFPRRNRFLDLLISCVMPDSLTPDIPFVLGG